MRGKFWARTSLVIIRVLLFESRVRNCGKNSFTRITVNVVKVMTVCRLSNNGNVAFLEKWGIHFFSKDALSRSQSSVDQVFRFALLSGSLVILTGRSMIELKKIRENKGLGIVYLLSVRFKSS